MAYFIARHPNGDEPDYMIHCPHEEADNLAGWSREVPRDHLIQVLGMLKEDGTWERYSVRCLVEVIDEHYLEIITSDEAIQLLDL